MAGRYLLVTVGVPDGAGSGGSELEMDVTDAVGDGSADCGADCGADGNADGACPDAGETAVTPLPLAPNLNRMPIPNRATVAPLPA